MVAIYGYGAKVVNLLYTLLVLSGGYLMCAARLSLPPLILGLTSGLHPRREQKGWLLLAVIVMLMLISVGVVMLMSQAQLSLRGVAQEHQAMQEKINQWQPLLEHKAALDAL